MPGNRDLLVQGLDLLTCFRQAAFALPQFQPGIEACRNAIAHQAQGFVALRQRSPGHRQLFVQSGPLHVVARHIAGQQHAGCVGIGGSGVDCTERGIQRRAVLAEKVDFPAPAQLQRAGFLNRTTQWRRVDVGAAEFLPRQVERAVELGPIGCFRQCRRRPRPGQPRLCALQIRIAGNGLLDQGVQLGIAKSEPPLAVYCVCHRLLHRIRAGIDGRQILRTDVTQSGVRSDAGHIGAGGQGQHCDSRQATQDNPAYRMFFPGHRAAVRRQGRHFNHSFPDG